MSLDAGRHLVRPGFANWWGSQFLVNMRFRKNLFGQHIRIGGTRGRGASGGIPIDKDPTLQQNGII